MGICSVEENQPDMSEVIYTTHFTSVQDALKYNLCIWFHIPEKHAHLDRKGVCIFAYTLNQLMERP